MGKIKLSSIVFVAALLVLSISGAQGRENGITGVYQNGCGGAGCHGGGANAATTLQLTGPMTMRTGETGDYVFRVSHAQQDAGGLNLAFLPAAGGPTGTLTAGAGSRVQATQLTHVEPVNFVQGAAEFDFSWQSPNAHGIYTFRGAGNAVNNDGSRNGDIWNVITNQITVKGATVTAPANGASFCQGGTLAVRWTQTGLTTLRIEMSSDDFVTVFNLANTADATTGILNYNIPAAQPASNAYVVRIIDVDGEVELGRSGTFTISDGPAINLQPVDVTLCEGRTLTLSVGATGKDVVYRWRKDGNDIAGGTTAELRIPAVTKSREGVYDCVVTACETTINSDEAQVIVQVKPRITKEPVAVSVCEGEPVEFSIDATGSDLTFQWFKNGVFMPTEDSRLLRFAGASLADDADYKCEVSGACQPRAVSEIVRLSIIAPPSITLHPMDLDIKVGEELLLAVVAEGDDLKYQWYGAGTSIDGANEATYVVAVASLSDAGMYTVDVWNRCDSVSSESAIVKVGPGEGPGKLVLSVDTVHFGEVPICMSADTLIVGLLINQGGTEIIVEGATITPDGSVIIVEPSFPITIAAGESASVTLMVTDIAQGIVRSTVNFKSDPNSAILDVLVIGTGAFRAEPDTLVFAAGGTGETRCVMTLPNDCPETVISGIELEGARPAHYEIVDEPDMPITLKRGETMEVCVRTVDTADGSAELIFETSSGEFVVDLVRVVVSDVHEERYQTITGLTVAPNPMKEEVRIYSPKMSPMTVEVYTVMGQRVASISGVGEVIWDGRDLTGAYLPAALYVLRIEQGHGIDVVKLLLER